MKKLALILGLSLSIVSCSTSKVVKDEVTTPVVSESSKIINQTIAKKSKFKDLTIQAKVTADLEGLAGDVKATIFVIMDLRFGLTPQNLVLQALVL